MAMMENMTEEEVKEMQAIFEEKIKPKNKEAAFYPFTMRDPFKMPEKNNLEKFEDKITDLSIQVAQLEHFIKTVFDGHVLIDGQFRKITP